MSQPLLSRLFEPIHQRTIVTGGGSGIGRAVALALADLGGEVFVMGRRLERLAETAALARSGRITPIACDIRDRATVDAAFDQVERGGVAPALVHAAAEVYPCPAEQLTVEVFTAAIASQLTGTFNVLQRWGLALLAAGRHGNAIAYSSALCARETPGISHSSASKAGVESMFRSIAAEWADAGIRLNVIGPGMFPIPGVHHEANWVGERAAFVDERVPLGRPGNLDEIVGPTLFMLSPAAGYMTGEVMIVDGGLRLVDFPVPRVRHR
jgi:NAD(P)-dependent dehydrogenase (short-subunit alcohol dehydrogenase family)